MKKTPSAFAAAPAANVLQAFVAVAALSGIASNITSSAHATEGAQATYNPATQKSIGVSGLDMITYNTVQTQTSVVSHDDAKTTTDQF
jgi:hypothetical protein